MSTLIRTLREGTAPALPRLDPVRRRGAAVAALAAVALAVPGALPVVLDALADAYLAVSVFVAGTLALLVAAQRHAGLDLPALLAQHRRWHVPVGAALGAFPGCGGAIIAVTQFAQGRLGFGALVATLIATMGDAMFLLLARDPASAAVVTALSVGAAVTTGYLIDALHGDAFLRPRAAQRTAIPAPSRTATPGTQAVPLERIWLAFAAPGLVLGIAGAFQVDVDAMVAGEPARWIGISGAALALGMWVVRGSESTTTTSCAEPAHDAHGPLRRLVDDTNFVTAWVVFAFAGFELLQAVAGVDVARLFDVWGPLVPLVAVLTGFVPGCGPQIVVTSLYLAGSLPLSAQLGNAIANDGDALFPAIAAAPRAALVATLYSALPAAIVAYGWYWLAE